MKHIHILGICGTFMGGIAVIAREMGFRVTGCDLNVYPPMSDTLAKAGIELHSGYDPQQLQERPDLVIIGNAISRGNPLVEYVLDNGIDYISGPQWLAENVLHKRHVIAIAATHGKTTTTSLLTWILTYANLAPGYLIGGVANSFATTAALGKGDYFVIEADEYDTAFFDKRSKFLHYRPRTLIINNIEFDHADIFDNLQAIQKQFHYLVRTVPANGSIIYPNNDVNVTNTLKMGCWSAQISFDSEDSDWQARNLVKGGEQFDLYYQNKKQGTVRWKLLGEHNVHNALAAIAAAHQIGIDAATSIAALEKFQGVKRRLEFLDEINGITVYDDFAHHPTAIEKTITALRHKVGEANIVAVVQFASNTMRSGAHSVEDVAQALRVADQVILLKPADQWDINPLLKQINKPAHAFDTVGDIVQELKHLLKSGDQVLIMSNKGFDGIQQKLLLALRD